MIIGINLLYLIPGKVGGTEVFARNIVEELSKLDKKNKYILFLNIENSKIFKKLPKNFLTVVCKFNATNRYKRILWEQIILPFQCYFYKVDVLHSLGYTSPLVTHCPRITTIYDLNYHFFPEDFSLSHLIVLKILIPLVAKSANKIVVHSNKSKSEMVKLFKIPSKKVIVTYGGVSKIFNKRYDKKTIDGVLKKYKIKKPFIFSAATSHPHKNLKSLIYAYDYLIKNKKIDQNLVLLGFSGRGQSELNRILQRLKLKKKVVFTGWVDPYDMPMFYKASDLFVFPSLYEGFGLPLVESMASGVPLITSDASCIPEIVENGALVVDTKSHIVLGDAIYKVINNKKLSKRIVKFGLKRSKKFSWRKLAEVNLKLYEKEAKTI